MDPYQEFFVACADPSLTTTPSTPAAAGATGGGAGPDAYGDGGNGGGGGLPSDERLWHHTYCLRRDMVPKCVGSVGLVCVHGMPRAIRHPLRPPYPRITNPTTTTQLLDSSP